jgi:hypothetical protein
MTMPTRQVRHIKNRRAVPGTRVQDLEGCLEESVEVHGGAGIAIEVERVVAAIPPAMY